MPLLLNIDAATEQASVYLSNDGKVIAIEQSLEQKSHASFLQLAIDGIFSKANISLSQIDAVAVTAGPGSYTGLRVGLASAKGLCYASNKPLILLNTLEIMAFASVQNQKKCASDTPPPFFYCPMIDARRMEAFIAIYDSVLKLHFNPTAVVLNEHFFNNFLNKGKIVFSGSGHYKLKSILQHKNAIYSDVIYDANIIVTISEKKFHKKVFSNVAYCEPLYIKEAYITASKR